ncbi:hypothetical protein HMPREF3213_01693 [Heyndrickxia coagulans]|uniref:Uncharacterized protein n=1 Tax=Heyndrickxia coagulans TaxID=1398 RepID=A0A133KSX0_HEYCO|nr:hypothetical protein HMPREF3213_01693 [Heyndrickxia coagulans]
MHEKHGIGCKQRRTGPALFFLVKKMFSETNDLNKSQNIEMAALIYFVRYSIILENNLYLEVFTWQL